MTPFAALVKVDPAAAAVRLALVVARVRTVVAAAPELGLAERSLRRLLAEHPELRRAVEAAGQS